MIDLLTEFMRGDGRSVAEAWQPGLSRIRAGHGGRVPDWERVFPGLVALVGIQAMLWPFWHSAVTATSVDNDNAGSASRRPYSAPAAGGRQPLWRFAFGGAAEQVAWALASGPALIGFDRAFEILTHRDVALTLASLDANGKVVVTGWAATVLEPLLGKRLHGDAPIDLPVCDCEPVRQMLPDWRASFGPVKPILADTAARFREWQASAGGAQPSATDEALGLGFACLAGHVWQGLLDLGCFTAKAPDRSRGLSAFGSRRELATFIGVLLLRGDHWALWQDVKEQVAAEENQSRAVGGGAHGEASTEE